MTTLNLLRAEWLKTRKRLINRALLAIIPALLALIMILVMIQAHGITKNLTLDGVLASRIILPDAVFCAEGQREVTHEFPVQTRVARPDGAPVS